MAQKCIGKREAISSFARCLPEDIVESRRASIHCITPLYKSKVLQQHSLIEIAETWALSNYGCCYHGRCVVVVTRIPYRASA